MSDYVDMDKVNALHIRFSGLQNRTMLPDKMYLLPPIDILDRYSRCFVTQESHTVLKNKNYCTACDHVLTRF